jgi:hypothetical protein
MVKHLFSTFLEERDQYGKAVSYWVQLWEQVSPHLRMRDQWECPWGIVDWEGKDAFMDGNPIFSAYSPPLQKAIRIIQHPPESEDLELEYWLDTYGGSLGDADAIEEIVVSCALSEEAAGHVLKLMQAWLQGSISISYPVPPHPGYPVIEPSGLEPESELMVV